MSRAVFPKMQQFNDPQQKAVFVRPRSGTSTGPALVPHPQSASSCCDVGGCWDWDTPSTARPWADAATLSPLGSQSNGATEQTLGGPGDIPVSTEGVISKGMGLLVPHVLSLPSATPTVLSPMCVYVCRRTHHGRSLRTTSPWRPRLSLRAADWVRAPTSPPPHHILCEGT